MILITGGLGYLGGRIAEYLIKIGEDVRIGSSKKKPHIPTELSLCEVVNIDFSDNASIDKACENVTCIVHLAALNAVDCSNNPESALLVNSLGTLKLLESARKKSVSRFLYFSTAHVYGTHLSGVISEKSLPNPSNHYAITHRAAEDYVISYNNNKFNTCVFRLTNVIGSPLTQFNNCWMLISNDLCRKIAMNQELIIYSNKLMIRDFISMQDIISSTCYFIKTENKIPGGEIVNISSGAPMTLERLSNIIIERAREVLGYSAHIFYKNKDNNKKNQEFFISNKKAIEYGFEFNTGIQNEIDKMLICYDKWFGGVE
jgi:UDP-glucose 4-epimerase